MKMRFIISLLITSILLLIINKSNARDIWSPEDEEKFIKDAGCGELCCGKNQKLEKCQKQYPGFTKPGQCVTLLGKLLERGACTPYGYKPYRSPIRKKNRGTKVLTTIEDQMISGVNVRGGTIFIDFTLKMQWEDHRIKQNL